MQQPFKFGEVAGEEDTLHGHEEDAKATHPDLTTHQKIQLDTGRPAHLHKLRRELSSAPSAALPASSKWCIISIINSIMEQCQSWMTVQRFDNGSPCLVCCFLQRRILWKPGLWVEQSALANLIKCAWCQPVHFKPGNKVLILFPLEYIFEIHSWIIHPEFLQLFPCRLWSLVSRDMCSRDVQGVANLFWQFLVDLFLERVCLCLHKNIYCDVVSCESVRIL